MVSPDISPSIDVLSDGAVLDSSSSSSLVVDCSRFSLLSSRESSKVAPSSLVGGGQTRSKLDRNTPDRLQTPVDVCDSCVSSICEVASGALEMTSSPLVCSTNCS